MISMSPSRSEQVCRVLTEEVTDLLLAGLRADALDVNGRHV